MTFHCQLHIFLLFLPFLFCWPHHHSCSSHFDAVGLEILNCSSAHFQKISTKAQYGAPRNVWMPSLFTAQIKELYFSGNQLSDLNSSSFLTLRYPETLEKLDLSNNRIVSIAPNAFQGLRNLKHLDLSGNRLYTINRTTFNGLESLETLILDGNFFSAFPEKTFTSLQQLKLLSIRSNQLACDCQLTDFFKSLQRDKRQPIRISNETRCVFPMALRDTKLSDIDIKVVKRTCGKGDFNPELFEIEPSAARSLIVYPGDERQISCRISNTANVSMEWLRNGAPIKETEYNGRLSVQMRSDLKIKTMTLTFKSVSWADSGYWTCYAEHKESSLRMTIRIMPISANTEKCVQEWTADEKGEIVWAETKQSKTILAPCPAGPKGAHARRQCKQGRWSPVDSSECAFASEVTRRLFMVHSRGDKQKFIQEFLNITTGDAFKNSMVELSAYDTRLASWLIGNATNAGGSRSATAVAVILHSPYARSEANGKVLRRVLQDSLINEVSLETEQISACQYMVLPQSIDQFSNSETPEDGEPLGFLAAKVGKRYMCVKQSSVDLLSVHGMTSIRIPAQTIESLPPVTVLRAYWFGNQRLFPSRVSESDQWVAHGEVQALALKKVNLKLYRVDQPKNIQSAVQSLQPTTLHPAIYLSFPIKYSTENTRFGLWSDKHGWTPVDETLCFTSIVGPESILVSCSSKFLSKLSENITYLSVLENATIYQMIQSHKTAVQLPWWTYVSSGFVTASLFIIILINVCYKRRCSTLWSTSA
ncbi:hypothetical protein L596_004044 [Steinernema carpocapsae]|uniref:Ig-like domain-containing protein n=1 Tax=Steinernema carpocapsae TaxID=34508 RepID=A0A4V6I864_STECR|nr:hypothetical protein L596_004044 [Steinernema carpocapsae]